MIHYASPPDTPIMACGVDRRTGGHVGLTNHPIAVTCTACRETEAFKRSVQRIPTIAVPVGLKHV